ncbi:hypothetical protein [Protofrankia symbiont of Coriaria ruscifolia]|uniref:hypothetical protein n=1 Tax=Protofrankia symbiont of Coriaria ruscifolia TaxID=1306542 RepID=UPI0013EF6EE4|nr:hypothetical protein [Protofrankia symbiont of Coriaria ruscifolia]
MANRDIRRRTDPTGIRPGRGVPAYGRFDAVSIEQHGKWIETTRHIGREIPHDPAEET